MKKRMPSDIIINHKEKRNAYYKVLDFINSNRCYDGVVEVIYGLRRTGKTTIMEQIMTDNSDKLSFWFLEVTKKDTMEDVYRYLDDALKIGVDCVFIDEITNIPDFIDEAALLADIYAKEGLKIVLSGTDSLSFIFAENGSLYGRTENISTTYIPFEEYCRVLGTKDMDDYISYGGLMKKGSVREEHIVYDYLTACRYLDDAVSGNISRSINNLARFSNNTQLMTVTFEEMRAVIEKMTDRYSGVLNTTIANEELKKVVLLFPTDESKFKSLEGAEIFYNLKANKPNIVKEFVSAINADTRIIHKFNEDMVLTLENELIRLGFISATNKQNFIFDENFGWRSSPLEKEYYLIQPAVKYYHLKNAVEFVEEKDYYNNLSEKGKQYIRDKLDSKIRGDMTEQIVVYEVAKVLPSDKYFVCKVTFENASDQSKGKYDMLIYDKEQNSYHAFEIKHTSNPYHEQYKHLMNDKFREIIDFKFGNKENVCVLYNGASFENINGVVYLNISDFLKTLTKEKDVARTFALLENDIPIINIESDCDVNSCNTTTFDLKNENEGFEITD